MNQIQLLQVQALRRAQAFLDGRQDVVGTLNSTSARKTLDASVARIGTTVDEQGTRSRETRGETNRRLQLEAELRNAHMGPIAEFARARLTGTPNFAALTPAAGRFRGERLVNAARAMADAAAPFAAQFTEASFPADFLDQLRLAGEEVRSSIDARATKHGQRAGATQGLNAALTEGLASLRAISPVVKRALRGNDALLAEWRSASRVTRKAGRPAGSPVVIPAVEVNAA